MGKISPEQIDKWIKAVKEHIESDYELLNDPTMAERESVGYKKYKDQRDEILKLQEFLEKSKADDRFQPPNYISRVLHRTVTIYLINSNIVEGVVDGFNNYEIRIKTDKKDILVPKHAIILIEGDFSRQDKAKKEVSEIT